MAQLSAQLAQLGYDPAAIEKIVTWAIYLTIVSVIAAIPTGMIARRRNRSVTGWVVLALCIPVLPLLIVWQLPEKRKREEKA